MRGEPTIVATHEVSMLHTLALLVPASSFIRQLAFQNGGTFAIWPKVPPF